MSGITGLALGIGEAGAGLSNAVQQYRENAARYREQKQREEMTEQQIKLTEAENEEAQQKLQAGRLAALQSQIKLQRDNQLRKTLPRYIQAAAPEDKQIISAAVDLGNADPEAGLSVILNYYNAKSTAGWKQAQAIATAELQAKKEQIIQDREDQRAQANRKAQAEGRKQTSKAAMDRAVYTQGQENLREKQKKSDSENAKKSSMTNQEKASLAGLDVLSGSLDNLSKHTDVLDSTYARMKVSRVLKMGEKGMAGDYLTIEASKHLSPDEQDYVNAFNQARDSIQSLRTFSGNPRSNMILYNSFISLLPDPLTTANSAMARAKITQLRKQIETVKRSLASQGVTSTNPATIDFKDLLNGAK